MGASAAQVGAFAPLTEAGTVVVDGVLCSNYADVLGWGPGFHDAAQRALLPWRSLLAAALLPRRSTTVASAANGVQVAVHGAACGHMKRVYCGKQSQGLHPIASLLLATSRALPLPGW